MGTNKLVWVGLGLLMVMVIVAIINTNSQPAPVSGDTNEQTITPAAKQITLEDGDTVAETIREVQARYDKSLADNKSQTVLIEKLNQRLEQLEGKRPSVQTDPKVQELTGKLLAMENDFKILSGNVLKKAEDDLVKKSGYEVSGYDLGWSESENAQGFKRGAKSTSVSVVQALPGYVTVRPMSRARGLAADDALKQGLAAAKLTRGSGITSSSNSGGLVNTVKQSGKGVPDITPHYTIPARGTIFKATAMTALIGTVPLGGRVQDPFPAKIIVGSENLATNGLRIPGLQGIVFEGVARGNWNLSCVSVSLLSATYTFEDGRIQHMQYDQKQGGVSRDAKATSPFSENDASRGIGYITNPQGVPCIPGRRVTDAHKQLFTMGVLGAAKSYFDAKAAAETTSSTNPLGGGTTTVTGDQEAFVNNSTYGDTVSTAMDFYNKRMRDTFDVIYVDPGAVVSMNITQDLRIDYHSDARKLAYSTGGSNAQLELD